MFIPYFFAFCHKYDSSKMSSNDLNYSQIIEKCNIQV